MMFNISILVHNLLTVFLVGLFIVLINIEINFFMERRFDDGFVK